MVSGDSAPEQAPQAAYDMALWQLTEQVHANRSFDTRAGAVLTVAAAFAGLFVASLPGAVGSDPARPAGAAVVASGVVVLATFGWTLFAFYRTVRPARWAHGPEPQDLIEVAAGHGEPQARFWIAETLVGSIAANEDAAQEKADWFRRQLYGAVALGCAASAGLVAVALVRWFG